MINDRNFTLQDLALAHRVMDMPEPLMWVHRDHGVVVGLIEGWIHDGVAEVDHMVLLPLAQHKLTVMGSMSRQATSALHARGLDVVIKIARSDPRYSALEAWAKRQQYVYYANNGEFDFYINPASKGISPDGQGKSTNPEAAPRRSRKPGRQRRGEGSGGCRSDR